MKRAASPPPSISYPSANSLLKPTRLTWNQVIAVCILIVHYDSVAARARNAVRDGWDSCLTTKMKLR